GETAAALERLQRHLAAVGGSADVEKQVLAFAQQRSLDAIVELVIRGRIARDPGKTESVFELASFLLKRKRDAEADKVLQDYASGVTSPDERQRRLRAVASFYNTSRDVESAEKAARHSVAQGAAGREDYMQLADVLAQRSDTAQALELLERAWGLSRTFEERTDVDERVLALLAGEQAVKLAAPAAPGSGFRLPAIFTGEGFGADAPTQKQAETPEAVRDYALSCTWLVSGSKLEALRSRLPANNGPWLWVRQVFAMGLARLPSALPERTLRAAWWCFRAEETQLAYELLAGLHRDPSGQWRTASIEVEKLLLDLALSDKNTLLAIRQLRLLATLDASNRNGYLLRLAEQEAKWERDGQQAVANTGGRWQMAQRGANHATPRGLAEAIRILVGVVQEEPGNEPALSALSQFYLESGQRDAALALWERAAAQAKGNAAPLLERYGELLLAQRKHKEFVDVQMRVIAPEADVKRRREAFSRMLERLLWSDVVQGTLPDEELRQRIALMLTAVQDHGRRAPFDGFWHEAAAILYEKLGDTARAFAEMKQAYYTAPDTPFSLDQLRATALKAGDQKGAIYFQKQIAAAAPATASASEWRALVDLLEQDFRVTEADQVRRRLEARFSQDPPGLEELARYYGETGQEDAARRVQEQVVRLRGWDGPSLLRLAVLYLRLGDHRDAEATLRQVLAHVPAAVAPPALQPERRPWPFQDERKAQPSAPSAMLSALENVPGLEPSERDRLRTFLTLPRGEFSEVPTEATHLRLRAVEELAKLGASCPTQTATERIWAHFYTGEGGAFRQGLVEQLGSADTLEAQFLRAWLTVKSHGMTEALAWARTPGLSDAQQRLRKGLVQASVHLLAEDTEFEFPLKDMVVLGESALLSNTELVDIARNLEGRGRHEAALQLATAAQRNAPALAADYALALAGIAEAAKLPALERSYLEQAWSKPLEAAGPRALDAFLQSTAKLLRLAPSAVERERLIRESWVRLRRLPESGLGKLREARLLGLLGADEACADRLASYFGNGFLTARKFIEPIMGGALPPGAQPGPRIDELNHMRSYWDDLREWADSIRAEGLAWPLTVAERTLNQRLGGVPLGPKSNAEFSSWRKQALLRELRYATHPQRVRLVRDFLGMDDSVDTYMEVGKFLESNGLVRDCIEVYRRLPGRAFSNVEYCEQFLRVCDQAWECSVAIPYIEKLFASDPQFRPLTLAENLLEEKHAKFLARLHDTLRLRLHAHRAEGTAKPATGRMAAEVPYLKELALLLERDGDKPGALAAWEELCQLWGNDPEAHLHRARLLVEQKNSARALEALRSVELTALWEQPVREAMELRVRLAVQAGLWAEVRDVMNQVSAPPGANRLPPTRAIVALARVLAAQQRAEDAQGLLLRCERLAKQNDDRFWLRLEQLKLAAQDPAWQPAPDRARIAALLRMDCEQEEPLQELLDFISAEAKGARASAWREVVFSLPDRGTRALAGCGLAPHLTEAEGATLRQAWAQRPSTPRLGPQKLAVRRLLDAGR
ncbi:MAG: tetratricopeptide repeat protein, partial [Roseimicrobium sp.]